MNGMYKFWRFVGFVSAAVLCMGLLVWAPYVKGAQPGHRQVYFGSGDGLSLGWLRVIEKQLLIGGDVGVENNDTIVQTRDQVFHSPCRYHGDIGCDRSTRIHTQDVSVASGNLLIGRGFYASKPDWKIQIAAIFGLIDAGQETDCYSESSCRTGRLTFDDESSTIYDSNYGVFFAVQYKNKGFGLRVTNHSRQLVYTWSY